MATMKAVTARIPHLCDSCHWTPGIRGVATIDPGHRYLRHVAFPGDEGKPAWRVCHGRVFVVLQRCHAVRAAGPARRRLLVSQLWSSGNGACGMTGAPFANARSVLGVQEEVSDGS